MKGKEKMDELVELIYNTYLANDEFNNKIIEDEKYIRLTKEISEHENRIIE